MKKRFAIEYLGTQKFTDRFRDAFLPYQGNQTPAVQLLQKLQSPPLSCVSAIFEYDYVDKDYQDEFAAFYAKAFKRYPSRCVRIHFFDAKIPQRVRLNLRRVAGHYRGFLTIRPIDLHRVGRTVLQPTITDPHREFVHCRAAFHAHILGQRLTVEGMPFVQQDTQVGACAQASLWMVARYFSARFGLREFLPSQINQFAKSGLALGRPLPAERGLTSFQMLDALQGMGISALGYTLHDIDESSGHIDPAFPVDALAADGSNAVARSAQLKRRQTAKLADIAYRYIESGLPVIFETHNHAFVGIGHTYDPGIVTTAAIQRIPAFIVHNDNTGPYLQLPILAGGAPGLNFGMVESIIAVMPHEVALRGEEAEARARAAFAELLAVTLDSASGKTIQSLMTELRPEFGPLLGQLEYRTYLCLSTELQARLYDDIRTRRFPWRLGARMIELDYPKYVWVTEVSSSALLNQAVRTERKCLGRVIIDSTAPAHTRGEIFVHCCDVAVFVDRNGTAGGEQTYGYFPNSSPFAHRS